MTIQKKCDRCGGEYEIATYQKFCVCPYCGDRTPFSGFLYRIPDIDCGIYSHVKHWTDCPACRSPFMFLGPEKRKWRCPDCGYMISRKEKNKCVFWFCDECDTYMNVQDGFTDAYGKWRCTECGYENSVTRDDII